MSAEMMLHIRTEDITDEDMITFFYSTIGSKYCPLTKAETEDEVIQAFEEIGKLNQKYEPRWSEVCDKMANTPRYNLGDVSWLKASTCEDASRYVPPVIELLAPLFDDERVIDMDLLDEVGNIMLEAEKMENKSIYASNVDKVKLCTWLASHRGEKVFSISW